MYGSEELTETGTGKYSEVSKNIRSIQKEIRDIQMKRIDSQPQGFTQRIEELRRQQAHGHQNSERISWLEDNLPSSETGQANYQRQNRESKPELNMADFKNRNGSNSVQYSQINQELGSQILTKNELLLISLNDRIGKKMLTHSRLQREARKLDSELTQLQNNYNAQAVARYQQNQSKAMELLQAIEQVTGEINSLHLKQKQRPFEWNFKTKELKKRIEGLLADGPEFIHYKQASDSYISDTRGDVSEENFNTVSH